MPKKRGFPSIGELVVCKVVKVNPHSVFARLEEYDKEGMIHISEVSSGWVRDIRQHVKIGQEVIARVMNEGDGIALSIKRVNPQQRMQKIKEYKLEQRSEKMLELVAEKQGKTLDQAYEEVGYILQEKFGTLYEAFRLSLQKIENLKRYINDEWANAIKEIAEKNIELKEFEFRAKLMLQTTKPNGIELIKDILSRAEESGLEVKYIAAPEYLIKYHTNDAKKGQKNFSAMIEKLVASAKPDAEAKIEVLNA
jgi:translation initiation factor 2 subunit 1